MPVDVYKDKSWLYEHYVRKRMNLTDICDLLKQTYNIQITPQALYNWCKKYDLLRFRGKGRNLRNTALKRPQSSLQKQVEKIKRERRRRIQMRKKGYGNRNV
jgi:hypothetical protein